MKNNLQLNNFNLVCAIIVIFLLLFGLFKRDIISLLGTKYLLDFYPQLLSTLIGASLGIPVGLFINRLTEKKKDKKILISLLTFIKTELMFNQRKIVQLQKAAENIHSLQEIQRDDLRVLKLFTGVLSQESYLAAQTSIAFISITNDILLSGIINSYLNVQRISNGVVGIEEIESEKIGEVLIAYIKLCERAKEAIRFCLSDIDAELKKLGSTLQIID